MGFDKVSGVCIGFDKDSVRAHNLLVFSLGCKRIHRVLIRKLECNLKVIIGRNDSKLIYA
jgi:hypothetical protein